jgi:hypothetical protein
MTDRLEPAKYEDIAPYFLASHFQGPGYISLRLDTRPVGSRINLDRATCVVTDIVSCHSVSATVNSAGIRTNPLPNRTWSVNFPTDFRGAIYRPSAYRFSWRVGNVINAPVYIPPDSIVAYDDFDVE